MKILKFLKFMIVFCCWSVAWLVAMRCVVMYFWNFDFMSAGHWKMVASFWNANGTIKGISDYMLFLTLCAVVVIWFIGLRRLYRKDYIKMLLKPFEYFSKKQIEKYGAESKHVVIKNLTVGEKMTVDDLIEEKIKEEENHPSQKQSQNLREKIVEKIIERKGS